MKKLLLFPVLWLCLNISAQSTKTLDSLKLELQKAKADTVQLRLMQLLGKGYLKTGNSESRQMFRDGLALAEKINSSRWKQEFTLYIGIDINTTSNSDSAVYYLKKCMQMKDAETTPEIIFQSYFGLGQACLKTGNTKDATSNLLEALKVVNQPDAQLKRANIYRMLSLVMAQLGEDRKSIDYGLQGINCLGDSLHPDRVAIIYGQLSGIYFGMGHKDSSLYAIQKSFEYAEKSKNESSIMYALLNYITYYNQLNMPDSAEQYFKITKDFYARTGVMKETYSHLVLQMAEVAVKRNQFAKAEQLFNEADSLAELNASFIIRLEIKKRIAELYKAQKKWDAAFSAINEYYVLKDSMANVEREESARELDRKYNMSKKEKEIALLQKEKEKQEVINNAFIAVAALAALIGLILFFGFRNRGRLNKQLEEKNKLIDAERNRAIRSEQFKQQFLANMSHELRSPMNAVLGSVSLALQQNDISASKKYLETAQRSSKNLLGIINDILDLSKIESGKLPLETIPFNILESTQDVITAQSINLKPDKQQLIFETSIDKNLKVKADPLRYMQVLTNLINNAIKFTPQGKILVALNHDASKNRFQIVVKDQGIGMDDEQQKNLFQAYNQTTATTARKYGGTGLGLAITKQLIELMNGSITVSSKINEGTVFTVELPLEVTEEIISTNEQSGENLQKIKQLQSIRIILVDDLEENRMITHDVLKSVLADADIKTFTNGKELIDYLQTNPDLSHTCILTDLDMPVMNGFEATSIIRNQLKIPVPVIALTASVFIGNEDEFAEMGFNGIVIKPFVTADLIAEIAKAMNTSHS